MTESGFPIGPAGLRILNERGTFVSDIGWRYTPYAPLFCTTMFTTTSFSYAGRSDFAKRNWRKPTPAHI
jgi:hypothetical protein